MRKFMRWCGVLSLAAPLGALADPAEIVTQTTGGMTVDRNILDWLGLSAPSGTTSLPYSLTIRTIMDPQAPGFVTAPDDHYPTQLFDAQVEVTLVLGTQSYHYSGPGSAELDGYWHSYRQYVFFPIPGHPSSRLDVENAFFIPGIDFGAQPALSPPTITDGATSSTARLMASDNISAPDSQHFAMYGNASSYYVSLVPEAGEASMFTAGLLLLFLPPALRKARGATGASPLRRAQFRLYQHGNS